MNNLNVIKKPNENLNKKLINKKRITKKKNNLHLNSRPKKKSMNQKKMLKGNSF